jgi:hypothetical protein
MLLGEQYNDRYKEGFYEEMDFSCSVDYTDEVFTTLEETLDYVKQFYHCDSDLINIIKFFNDNSNGIAY